MTTTDANAKFAAAIQSFRDCANNLRKRAAFITASLDGSEPRWVVISSLTNGRCASVDGGSFKVAPLIGTEALPERFGICQAEGMEIAVNKFFVDINDDERVKTIRFTEWAEKEIESSLRCADEMDAMIAKAA